MSNITSPTTPNQQSALNKLSKNKPKRRKRKGSHHSNASIISIDHVSLKKLRKFQDKITKENKKQKQLYQEKKRKAYMKKYDLKEEDDKLKKFDMDKSDFSKSPSYEYDAYDSPQSKSLHPDYSPQTQGPKSGDIDISVDELLPIIKDLVDRHDKLQRDYDILDREFRKNEIVIDNLQRSKAEQEMALQASGHNLEYLQRESNGHQRASTMKGSQNESIFISESEHLEKMEFLKNRYEDHISQIELDYKSEIEAHQKQIKALNKELNEGDKEIDALRQSLEAMEHENQSLRISMNANNKTFQSLKILKKEKQELLIENRHLKEQIDGLEQEMDTILQQNEERERMEQSNYLNPMKNVNQRPQTPTHRISKTMVMGNVEALSNKGSSNQNVSDHDSSTMGGGGNDLLHQIGDYHDMSPPNDRDSNYGDEDLENENDGDNEDTEDDEKRISNDYENGMNEDSENVLLELSRYKEIGDVDPNSMQQIMALLQQKEDKRNNLSASQQNVDAFSLESNYSDSEQKLEEQLDSIEDEVRELKDMLLSLMDATNNITPQINQNLGPLLRKINRMYVMLSGPMQSRSSHLLQRQEQGQFNKYGYLQSVHSHQSERSSQIESSHGHKQNENEIGSNWFAILTPFVNDWIPSIGFSAIILSTMYLIVKYHNGRFIKIGQPRVLRNNRN